MKKLELAGHRFGQVEVVSLAGISPAGETLWNCRCLRCGRDFIAAGSRLHGERPRKDCGCSYAARNADLSGRRFGAMEALHRSGTSSHGDALYLCRCLLCGREKNLPATVLKRAPKSCGCIPVRFARDKRTAAASAAGVAKSIVDGCNVYTATRTTPNSDNTTGYRWVRVQHRGNGDFIFASFVIKGKRYYRGGFSTPSSAYAWAVDAHEKALKAESVEAPAKRKGKKS